jgi:hypothetical protein
LLRGVAPVCDALVELLLVLEAPRLARRYPDVELEVLRVVADGGAPKRLFEIEYQPTKRRSGPSQKCQTE